MADLVIRGMAKMPGNCRECMFAGFGGMRHELNVCMFSGESQSLLSYERMSKCPLVPLPAGHGRLGDLDKLDYAFTALRFNEDGNLNHWGDRKNWCLHGNEIETILANAPTIVPAEGGADNAPTSD